MLKEILRFAHDNGDTKYVFFCSEKNMVAYGCEDMSIGETEFFSCYFDSYNDAIKYVSKLIFQFVDEEEFDIWLADRDFFYHNIYSFDDEHVIEDLLNHFGISQKVAMINEIRKECKR